jgi:hypothetical protein
LQQTAEEPLLILDNFSSNHIWRRKVGAVSEAWKARPLLHPRYGVFEPEDVEVDLVALG